VGREVIAITTRLLPEDISEIRDNYFLVHPGRILGEAKTRYRDYGFSPVALTHLAEGILWEVHHRIGHLEATQTDIFNLCCSNRFFEKVVYKPDEHIDPRSLSTPEGLLSEYSEGVPDYYQRFPEDQKLIDRWVKRMSQPQCTNLFAAWAPYEPIICVPTYRCFCDTCLDERKYPRTRRSRFKATCIRCRVCLAVDGVRYPTDKKLEICAVVRGLCNRAACKRARKFGEIPEITFPAPRWLRTAAPPMVGGEIVLAERRIKFPDLQFRLIEHNPKFSPDLSPITDDRNNYKDREYQHSGIQKSKGTSAASNAAETSPPRYLSASPTLQRMQTVNARAAQREPLFVIVDSDGNYEPTGEFHELLSADTKAALAYLRQFRPMSYPETPNKVEPLNLTPKVYVEPKPSPLPCPKCRRGGIDTAITDTSTHHECDGDKCIYTNSWGREVIQDKVYPTHEYQPKPSKAFLKLQTAKWESILNHQPSDSGILSKYDASELEGKPRRKDEVEEERPSNELEYPELESETQEYPSDYSDYGDGDTTADSQDPRETGGIVDGSDTRTHKRTGLLDDDGEQRSTSDRTSRTKSRAASFAHLTSTVTDGMTPEDIEEAIKHHPDYPVLSMWWSNRYEGSDTTIEMDAATLGVPTSTLSTQYRAFDKRAEVFVESEYLEEMYPDLDLLPAHTNWIAVVIHSGKAPRVVVLAPAMASDIEIVAGLDRARDKSVRGARRDIRAKGLAEAETAVQIAEACERITQAYDTAWISGPYKLIGGLCALGGRRALAGK